MIRSPLVPTLLLASAIAAVAQPAVAAPTVDPNVIRALELGKLNPTGVRAMTLLPRRAPVLIELDQPVTAPLRASLQNAGITVPRRAGRAAGLERFIATQVDHKGLLALLATPGVRKISHAPPRGPLPLAHTTALLNLAAARGAHDGIDQLTGRGMVVADTDSNAEVFHPHFFHADGGYHDWIDVNDNGVFDPGTDAIDFDANGEVSPKEVARPLTAATYTRYGNTVPARKDGFDTGADWVYIDDNENGKRDYGIEAGFDDSVPAFGEPLFVPDDVNQNGTLDVGERFVRLGTSKFRKVYTSFQQGYLTQVRIYERGVDLTSHKNDVVDPAGGSNADHGTGVMSILLGDVPLVGRTNVGVAPEAEAVLVADLGGDTVTGAAWMLDEKPDVALWEMAPWVGIPLDGTDPYSQLVDATATGDNVAHACPAGNTGGSRKHAHLPVPAGLTTTLDFENPATLGDTYIDVSLNLRGAEDLDVRLVAPDGTVMDVTGTAGQQTVPIPGIVLYPTVQTTDRGTYFVDLLLYAYQAPQIGMPEGTWQVQIDGDAAQDAILDAYVMDEVSGWGPGVVFPEALTTDLSTLGAPSVADHCIAVGAYAGHPKTSEEPWFHGEEPAGLVRDYSGRGPRIDGVERLDIVAPDNPFAAAPHIPDYYGIGEIPYGAFWIFGGTSGAGPHVAGVATLLAQAGIRGDAARQAIRDGAFKDAVTQAEPRSYGAGRLNAAGALNVEPTTAPPAIEVTSVPSPAFAGEEMTLEVQVSDPKFASSELVTRWDDGYDGTWDTDYEPAGDRTRTHAEAGRYPYKVRVRNPGGRVAEAVIWVEVEEAPVILDAGLPDASEPDAGTPDASAPDASTPDAGGPPSAPGAAGNTEDEDGGCGCRVSADRTGRRWADLLALGMVAVLAARRRRTAK